jgi:ferredoxin
MAKVKRKTIRIDEEKCDGCGLCIPACPEGALQIIGGKARVVKESYCDGLGACLGDCPRGALTIEEKEVEEYDHEGVIAHLKEEAPEQLERHLAHLREHAHELPRQQPCSGVSACPSAQTLQWKTGKAAEPEGVSVGSELRQWPIQLHLVPPHAPYLKNADLVLVADCVPFAYADFHRRFLRGKTIAIGCPKLDDVAAYVDKLAQILSNSDVRSLTVVHMEVPCCYGFAYIVREALKKAGKDIPVETVVIGVKGEVKETEVQ